MLAIFPVLGLAFEKPVAPASASASLLPQGPDAEGGGEDRPDGFLVLANAKARIEETASLSPSLVGSVLGCLRLATSSSETASTKWRDSLKSP